MTPSTDVQQARKAWFAACREIKLGDEERKAIQSRICGKDSASTMTARDFTRCLSDLKDRGLWKPSHARKRAGNRPMAADPQSAKMRALWLALYHLGAVRDPAESALTAFAKRMTGKDALQWLDMSQGNRVIEALKDWCVREGFSPSRDGTVSKQLLLYALWAKLHALGAVRIADTAALDNWLTTGRISPHTTAVTMLSEQQLDQAAEKLGTWVRRAAAGRKN
ncbi:regulatory protein GemA [Paramagnetospirillum magneticum]|uniref:Mu-like prophage protein gp16 n=1 Tax=Paramagnetospirillum magneticum (strain ATCC 700264 / AMB-1) TaxID=342108 RepID=Q2WA59_PARM1|nr:regulatory protein GemA [Paramagnetospirillum magneticum]BAE49266.1 Mu-like prophage protein gp16 [Paramagnetospirillum magneticum AMB-1]